MNAKLYVTFIQCGKFENFSVTQILCETNYRDMQISKIAIFEDTMLDFYAIFAFFEG